MQATRAEIKGQKETLQKQNFENSFFQLLGMHSEIVNSMAIENNRYSGRECFGYMLDNKLKYAYYNPPPNRIQEDLNALYEQLFAEFQTPIGYYFRHLYNVVKFVDQHDFLGDAELEAKKFYTNLVRAQLSSDELGLLFYNCLSDRGAKFKDLVEKYALFEDMPLDVLIKEEHQDLYDPNAYGEMVYEGEVNGVHCGSSSCEMIGRRCFRTHKEARLAIFSYIEGWYNPHRMHHSITGLKPKP